MGFEKKLSLDNGQTPEPAISERYVQEVKEGIDPERDVTLFNPDRFDRGDNRFLYGFSWPADPNQAIGFIKGARIQSGTPEPLHAFLAQEAQALEIAGQLGIKAPRVLNKYREAESQTAYIHIEALNGEDGFPLTSLELIAAAKPVFGKWAAETLLQAAAREIPPGTDISAIKRLDERNSSLQAFWQTWESDSKIVLDSLSGEKKEALQAIFEKTRKELEPLVTQAETPDKNYLVHNDISPANTHFDEKKQEAVLLDFERSSVVHNPVLAWMTDVGNFYARSWSNPAMQKEYLKTIVEKIDRDHLAEEVLKLKATIVFESNFLAKWGVDPKHPEHAMTRALCDTVEENLNYIDQLASSL